MLRGKVVAIALASSLLVLVGGCKLVRAGKPPLRPPAPEAPTPSVKEMEKKVREKIEEEVRRETEKRVAEELERARREAFRLDLEAVKEMLDQAEAAVLEKKMEKAVASLGRVRVGLSALCASTQVSSVRHSALRASLLLGRGEVEGVRFHLESALKAAEGLKVGEVSVEEKINQALTALEGGKGEEAGKALSELEKALGMHPLYSLVERMFEHLDGAASAVGREAWKVAEAEVEGASELLKEMERLLLPPPREEKPPAVEEKRPEEGVPSSPTLPRGLIRPEAEVKMGLTLSC